MTKSERYAVTVFHGESEAIHAVEGPAVGDLTRAVLGCIPGCRVLVGPEGDARSPADTLGGLVRTLVGMMARGVDPATPVRVAAYGATEPRRPRPDAEHARGRVLL